MTYLLTVLTLLFFQPPAGGEGISIGECAPVGSSRIKMSPENKAEVRRRVHDACENILKASPTVCAFYDALVRRESYGGNSSVRHTKGVNENGAGPMGLSLIWHKDKWPGKDEDPAFCTPEASLIVAHAIVWRAFTRYHARNMVDAQAIYSGRWYCARYGATSRKCYADPSSRTRRLICGRMRDSGFSCNTKVTRADLGVKVHLNDRRAWVEEIIGHPVGPTP